MIVHIATDEKFINSAYTQFNNIEEGRHYFYILVDDVNQKLRYVKLEKHMHLVNNKVDALKELAKSLHSVELVCFHGMSYHNSIILNRLQKKQKILWILFGKEFYNNQYFFTRKKLVGGQTYNKFLKQSSGAKIKSKFKNYFRGLNYLIKKGTRSPYYEITHAMKRANYCGVLYEEEFQYVKDKLKTDIEYLKYTYYPIELMLEDVTTMVSGPNILLGNSAHITNNHLEAFDILRGFKLNEANIISPLSYGNKNYKDTIIKIGINEFGESFTPLVEFLPLHEYNNYLTSCSIVVMNHYRQQAVGNVLTMIWMGAKVYLNVNNTLYHYLKRIGVYVFDINMQLVPENKDALKPLSEEKKLHNRNCLVGEITQDVTLLELKNAIQRIKCH